MTCGVCVCVSAAGACKRVCDRHDLCVPKNASRRSEVGAQKGIQGHSLRQHHSSAVCRVRDSSDAPACRFRVSTLLQLQNGAHDWANRTVPVAWVPPRGQPRSRDAVPLLLGAGRPGRARLPGVRAQGQELVARGRVVSKLHAPNRAGTETNRGGVWRVRSFLVIQSHVATIFPHHPPAPPSRAAVPPGAPRPSAADALARPRPAPSRQWT